MQITKIPGQVFESALSVVGVRVGTEEPHFIRRPLTGAVAQSRNSSGHWTIRFFMPSKWTMETLPTPDDDTVRLVTVPAETVAVLRFSGDRSPKAVASRTDELLKTL